MQDLVKQMETMQREYLLERQALRAQLLAAVQSQEVVADLPLAALYSIPGKYVGHFGIILRMELVYLQKELGEASERQAASY